MDDMTQGMAARCFRFYRALSRSDTSAKYCRSWRQSWGGTWSFSWSRKRPESKTREWTGGFAYSWGGESGWSSRERF